MSGDSKDRVDELLRSVDEFNAIFTSFVQTNHPFVSMEDILAFSQRESMELIYTHRDKKYYAEVSYSAKPSFNGNVTITLHSTFEIPSFQSVIAYRGDNKKWWFIEDCKDILKRCNFISNELLEQEYYTVRMFYDDTHDIFEIDALDNRTISPDLSIVFKRGTHVDTSILPKTFL